MNWSTTTISKGCTQTATRDPRRTPEEPFHYIDISGIDRTLKTITSTAEILGAEAASRARKIVKTGDVLVSTVRPNLNAVAMVPPELDGAIASTGFCVLRPKPKALNGRYLFFYAQHPDFVAQLMACVRGANYPAVTDRVVKEANIPLPPPSEQRRIVEILDQADALRKKRAEADKIADRILPSLFYKMFGDSQTHSVEIQSLIDDGVLIVHKDGNYGSSYPRKDEFGEDGVPFLSAFHLDERGFVDAMIAPRLNHDKANTLPFGWIQNKDILLAHNATVGRVGFIEDINEPMLIGTSLTCYRVDPLRTEPLFLFAALRSAFFQGQLKAIMGQGTRNQVPITAQRKLRIPMASQQSQQMIARHIAIFRKTLKATNCVRPTLDTLFETLLHRAFSGDLTAKWRESHMKELLQEMELQAKELGLRANA